MNKSQNENRYLHWEMQLGEGVVLQSVAQHAKARVKQIKTCAAHINAAS